MGISCQIYLFKPPTGVYQPGDTVSGIIKYAIDKITVFDKITISLKGYGLADVQVKYFDRTNSTYKAKEVYVDVDNVITNESRTQHDVGMYERRFEFILPFNTPSTLKFKREDSYFGRTLKGKCDIKYYIRIKFEKPGLFNLTKRYKTEFNVSSALNPKLSKEPVVYNKQNKLFKPFASEDSIVNIKAVIKNSVITPGEKIQLDFEVTNNTDLTVKGVTAKLKELYTFTTKSGKEYMFRKIDNAESKTASIKSGETQNFECNIDVPLDINTFRFSRIVSRDYYVKLKADLPFPRKDVVLNLPVEIGAVEEEAVEVKKSAEGLLCDELGEGLSKPPSYDDEFGAGPSSRNDTDPPPSYWEAMVEDTDDEASYLIAD